MNVFRCILEHASPQVVFQFVVEGNGLETAPAERDYQRVPGLQNFLVPPVLFNSDLKCMFYIGQ